MLNRFSNRLVEALSESGLIEHEDREIYLLGLELSFIKLLHYATMLLIGLFFGMALETILFIICFSALRVYAGGYHAKSRLGCWCVSWIMMLSVLFLIKICPSQIMSAMAIGISLPSCLIIYILAPVENEKKRLDNTEILHFRKISKIILLVELSVSIVFLLANSIHIPFVISLSLLSIAVMLILGEIQILASESN